MRALCAALSACVLRNHGLQEFDFPRVYHAPTCWQTVRGSQVSRSFARALCAALSALRDYPQERLGSRPSSLRPPSWPPFRSRCCRASACLPPRLLPRSCRFLSTRALRRVTARAAAWGQIFTLVNFAVLPFWALMIFAPKWEVTEKVSSRVCVARACALACVLAQALISKR